MDYQGNVQYINEYNVEEGYPNSNEEITGEIITPRNGLTVHELIEEFHSITNMELDDCARLLERAKWNLEVSEHRMLIDLFMVGSNRNVL